MPYPPLVCRRHLTMAAVALLLPLAAAADTLTWTGNMIVGIGGVSTYQRPTKDGQSLADQGPVKFHMLSIFVDRTGEYTLTSDQRVFPEDAWDGFLALYAGDFYAQQPLRNLIAANDDGPEGSGTSQITADLVAGVIYRVVLSYTAPRVAQDNYRNSVTGPGTVRRSACFVIGDEVDVLDDGSDISLLDELYCPTIRFRDGQGGEGVARPVPHRSNESALFWFYHPANWEVQIKVLDACVVNGFRWVFIAGTTDVELEIEVVEKFRLRRRTYRNDLGDPTRSILDSAAFSCDKAPSVD